MGESDTVLLNGNILTMDSVGTTSEAVAIRRGRIYALGTTEAILSHVGTHTRLVELGGRTMIPGIIDTHAHMEREGLKTLRPSLAAARSIADILEIIAQEKQSRPAGEWIVTMPVGQPPFYFGGPLILRERRMPTRHELDAVTPDHPVCIAAAFGNWGRPPCYTALNSMALQKLGIDQHTQSPGPGVEIEHDPDTGEPNGIIIERNNRPLADITLLRGITGFSFKERVLGLERSMAFYNSVGTTSVYEGHGSSPETIAVYRELWERDAMTVRARLCVSPTWTSVEEARRAIRDWLPLARGRGFGDRWLRVSGLFVGFGGNAKTATASRAALPNTGWTGFVEWANDLEDFHAYAMLAAEYDIRLNTIVVDGLAAILDIFEAVDRVIPISTRRWVIEHLKVIEPGQIERIRMLGLHVTTIPGYAIWKNGDILTKSVTDLERYIPHAALLEAGVRASAGTDNIPYNPFFTLQTLVTRRERTSGRVFGETQRLDVHRALRLLTSEAAHVTFEENVKGSIEIGKLADLAVLTRDPLTTPPDELGKISAHMTMVEGRIVHES